MTRQKWCIVQPKALQNNERGKYGYFGVISNDIVTRIKNEVTDISDTNRENLFKRDAYSLRIGQNEIAHLKKTGMSENEAIEYVVKIPQIVTEFDDVRYSVGFHDGRRINGLRFSKLFPDGKMYSYLMVSNKKNTLTVKTTYLDKGDYVNSKKDKKNKPSLVANADTALTRTSITRSTSAYMNIISHNPENATGNIRKNSLE